MAKYIAAAFWLRTQVPLLGRVPVNAVLFGGLLLLGLGHPAIALLALGLEAVYLTGLATNARFQNLVDAWELAGQDEPPPLPESLDTLRQQRLDALRAKTVQLRDLYRRADSALTAESNLAAVREIEDLFGRLLLAEQRLRHLHAATRTEELRRRIATADADGAAATSSRVRHSKQAVAELLRRRLEAAERRTEALACVDDDLLRVETQVDLAIEHANLDGRVDRLSSKLDLVSYQFASSADNLGEIGAGSLDFLLETPPTALGTADAETTTSSPGRTAGTE